MIFRGVALINDEFQYRPTIDFYASSSYLCYIWECLGSSGVGTATRGNGESPVKIRRCPAAVFELFSLVSQNARRSRLILFLHLRGTDG
jgi:hypothetical protein